MVHTWHISLNFFKLLSQPRSSDPYANPGRQVQEVINGHAVQVPSFTQQVHPCTGGLGSQVF